MKYMLTGDWRHSVCFVLDYANHPLLSRGKNEISRYLPATTIRKQILFVNGKIIYLLFFYLKYQVRWIHMNKYFLFEYLLLLYETTCLYLVRLIVFAQFPAMRWNVSSMLWTLLLILPLWKNSMHNIFQFVM